ncbi:hypothetical protein [Parasitella parasitica]|uniref:Uncharacterized protein n=1 Tax=Parasitella parasitica TaxID=35722 RepID=A0A0B7MRL6_9FUNG|nr:hypothetical protein [Parasitella parasitica]
MDKLASILATCRVSRPANVSEAEINELKYLKDYNNNVTFYPGEIELKAMTVQLKDQGITDKRLKYNADGAILFNRIFTEILLSEVSSAFAENNKAALILSKD